MPIGAARVVVVVSTRDVGTRESGVGAEVVEEGRRWSRVDTAAWLAFNCAARSAAFCVANNGSG